MMHSTQCRRVTASMAGLLAFTIMACQPYLSNSHPDVATQAIAWQCPTPSPVPTELLGYEPTPTPTGIAEPIYSTPVPTATPYVRAGSDFYRGQRIRVGPLTFAVVGYRVQPDTTDSAIHLIDIQVENAGAVPVEVHFEVLSLVRTIRLPNNQLIEGQWYHSDEAGRIAGVPRHDGVWHPGTAAATLAVRAPAGTAESWGMPFVDQAQRRSGTNGDGYIWIRMQSDPYCSDPGGPPLEAVSPPAAPGVPITGRGSWPVPPGTTISRGYGCHPFPTGVRAAACGPTLWWHDGIDFAAAAGTPLFATHDMTIQYVGSDTSGSACSYAGSQPPHTGFGLYVRAKDAEGYTYWYGHVSGFTVQAGQQVVAGEQIARMGSTGCSTGPHLHFRVRYNGQDRNPYDVIEQP